MHKNVQWRQGLIFGVLGTLGALTGARLTSTIDEHLLMSLFAVLLLIVAALMLRRAVIERKQNSRKLLETTNSTAAIRGYETEIINHAQRSQRAILTFGLASLIGLLTGIFGVGGGFAVVPALVLMLRVPMRLAIGTSLLVMIINTLTGILGRIGESYTIDWALTATFAGASMLGGFLAARHSYHTKPSTLTLLFALLLTAAAVATASQSLPPLL